MAGILVLVLCAAIAGRCDAFAALPLQRSCGCTRTVGLTASTALGDGPVTVSAAEAKVAPLQIEDAIRTHGVVRIDRALSAHTISVLLMHVNESLEDALKGSQDALAFDMGDVSTACFGDVLARVNRHDLKLDRARNTLLLIELSRQCPFGPLVAVSLF